METLFHFSPFSGHVYPNETVIPWTVLIVVYPYLTGLVAGASFRFARFIVLHDCCSVAPVAAPRASGASLQCHDHSTHNLGFRRLCLCSAFLRRSVDGGDVVCVSALHRTRGPTGERAAGVGLSRGDARFLRSLREREELRPQMAVLVGHHRHSGGPR